LVGLQLAMVAFLAFMWGGIPTAFLIGKLRGIDVRRHGSGNVGGTNVLRLLGWRWGVAVMAVDIGKGYVAVRLLPELPVAEAHTIHLALAAGVAAVLGHVFTPYLRFRGGKGVATAAGALLGLAPIPTLVAAGVFGVVVFGTRIVSLGSLSAAGAFPLSGFVFDRYTGIVVDEAVLWFSVGLAALVAWTHRDNIRRLVAGREHRFGRR